MVRITILFFMVALGLPAVGAVENPRLAKPEMAACVNTAKEFLRSNEYDEREEEEALINACRDVEGYCVKVVGERMASFERARADLFLPVIKACRGRGMGECYANMVSKLSSSEGREATQALTLLKKCE